MNSQWKISMIIVFIVLGMSAILLSLPSVILTYTNTNQDTIVVTQFPVTVDPRTKTITENTAVNAYLESPSSPLAASAFDAFSSFKKVFTEIAEAIVNAPWYRNIAQINSRFITITSGMRKEQVAAVFAKSLNWDEKEKEKFLTRGLDSTLPLAEGSFSPGTYYVQTSLPPESVQLLVNKKFTNDILSHYGTTTSDKVPLTEALTIASLLERETIGNEDMRLISGIIWNRIFANMNLQIDSTLQYVKANSATTQSWWPKVVPADKYRKSAFNTYMHAGLPPTPIANPSVAAVLAALNPIQTSCLYYFNDKKGIFHCSDTYQGHVALLKQYYGKGK